MAVSITWWAQSDYMEASLYKPPLERGRNWLLNQAIAYRPGPWARTSFRRPVMARWLWHARGHRPAHLLGNDDIRNRLSPDALAAGRNPKSPPRPAAPSSRRLLDRQLLKAMVWNGLDRGGQLQASAKGPSAEQRPPPGSSPLLRLHPAPSAGLPPYKGGRAVGMAKSLRASGDQLQPGGQPELNPSNWPWLIHRAEVASPASAKRRDLRKPRIPGILPKLGRLRMGRWLRFFLKAARAGCPITCCCRSGNASVGRVRRRAAPHLEQHSPPRRAVILAVQPTWRLTLPRAAGLAATLQAARPDLIAWNAEIRNPGGGRGPWGHRQRRTDSRPQRTPASS